MNYEKPEVTLLGSAASLIMGNNKANNGELGQLQIAVDCELDD